MMNKTESLTKMREKGAYDALELQIAANEGKVTETEIIDKEISVPAFDPTKDYSGWKANSPVADEGQVWLLLQPHNASHYDGRPATLRALWGLAHTKNPDKAKPWVDPYGTSGMYMKDECVLWTDGKVYKALKDNTVHTPEAYPAGWEEVV
jgi:hypothetical protein